MPYPHRILIALTCLSFACPSAQTPISDDPDAAAVADAATPQAFSIVPETAVVPAGEVLTFAASEPVTWSVHEEDGGSIDEGGLYSAPSRAGIYRIVASDPSDPSRRATAVVQVRSYRSELLAGALGGAGDRDAKGDEARFGDARGVVGVQEGDDFVVYVSDAMNHTIRRIAADGTTTTVAGRSGQAGLVDGSLDLARFDTPWGIAAWQGKLYVADHRNNCIRSIDLASGQVETVAGSMSGEPGSVDGIGGIARFHAPADLASDGDGQLYVADYGNHTIRKIDLSSQAVTTIAGSAGVLGATDGSAARFRSPEGLYWDDDEQLLYVADSGNASIRVFDPDSAQVSTFAGRSGETGVTGGPLDEARFRWPRDLEKVSFGPTSYLIVADRQASECDLRRINLNSRTVSVAEPSFESPYPLTWCSGLTRNNLIVSATVVVADRARIRHGWLGIDELVTLAGKAPERLIPSYVIDGSASYGWWTQSPETDGYWGEDYSGPTTVATAGGDRVVVTDGSSMIHSVSRVSRKVSTLVVTVDAFDPHLRQTLFNLGRLPVPPRPVLASGDDIWVRSGSSIKHVDLASGEVEPVAGGLGTEYGLDDGVGADARFWVISGLARLGRKLYVSDEGTDQPRVVDLDTLEVTSLPSAAVEGVDHTGLSGIAATGDGILYVTVHCTVRAVDTVNNTATTVAGSPGDCRHLDGTGSEARLADPTGLALDGYGALLVVDGDTVRRIDLGSATVTTFAGQHEIRGLRLGHRGETLLNRPLSVAINELSEIVITNAWEHAAVILRAD